MDLTIAKKDLLRGLARTHAVAGRKSSMPILSNILLTAEDGILRFAATDLYLSVNATAKAGVKTPGSVAVAAKTAFDIVKNLPEGEVRLVLDPKTFALRVTSGKIKFRVPGMPGEDFPPLPSTTGEFVGLNAATLLQLISLTSYSMSSDDTRPHLSGTFFECDGKAVRMVTTDGHRLSTASEEFESAPFSMLIPDKGIVELKRLLEDVKSDKTRKDAPIIGIATSGGSAFFRAPEVELSVKLADAQFPPWQKVIPKSHARSAVIRRDMLVDAMKRVKLVANETSGGIRMVLSDGKLSIESENPDVGDGSEELDIDYADAGLTIGSNVKYLLETLTSMPDDEVRIELGGDLDPIAIVPATHDGSKAVIMPVRL